MYSNPESYKLITYENTLDIKRELAPLIEPEDDNAIALRFDALMYGIELAYLMNKKDGRRYKDLKDKVKSISKIANIPEIIEQKDIIKKLQERISIFVDKKTQVVTVSVRMQDPVISARVTDNVVEKLKKYITNYRTQKAKKDLEFTEKVLKEAQDAYYKAQQTYAAFEDGNKNIVSASYRTELERLKNEMTLTFNVYNTLAQKQEQDKLRVQEQTPVYTIIEPASVPLKASTPKKILILIGCIFLDLIAISGYVLIRDRQIF